MDELSIQAVSAPTDEVRSLIGELDSVLGALYSAEQRHGLSLEAIFQPHIRFFLARLGTDAVGCGGVAFFPDFAELKRMYVRDSARGRGVARAVLERIERETRAAGHALLRLETGVHQHDAMRLFTRWGFQPCGPFGDYAALPPRAIATSVFLEKRLGPPGEATRVG